MIVERSENHESLLAMFVVEFTEDWYLVMLRGEVGTTAVQSGRTRMCTMCMGLGILPKCSAGWMKHNRGSRTTVEWIPRPLANAMNARISAPSSPPLFPLRPLLRVPITHCYTETALHKDSASM